MTDLRPGSNRRAGCHRLPRLLLAFLCVVQLLTLAPRQVAGQTEPLDRTERNLDRAVASYRAMQRVFWEADNQLYREFATGEQYAFQWPFARAMAATAALARVPDAALRYRLDLLAQYEGIEAYWDPYWDPPAYSSAVLWPWGGGGDRYYDDNNWIGLALLDVYRLTGEEPALERAEEVFAFVASGWQEGEWLPAPGGVRWIDADWNWDRNTISTAPAATLALQLAEQQPDPDRRRYYVDWARELYGWVQREMRDPETGLYYDRITWDGELVRDFNVDNQGAMIAAGVLLYRVTGDTSYLEEALATARAILGYYDGGWVQGAPPRYAIVLFGGLALLAEHVRDPALVEPIQRYADDRWDRQRDARTGVFTTSEPAMLIDQAALVETYALLARLGGPAPVAAGDVAGVVSPPSLAVGARVRLTPITPNDSAVLSELDGAAAASLHQPLVPAPPDVPVVSHWATREDGAPRFRLALRPVDGDELLGVVELAGAAWPERVTGITLHGPPAAALDDALAALALAQQLVADLRLAHSDELPPEEFLEP